MLLRSVPVVFCWCGLDVTSFIVQMGTVSSSFGKSSQRKLLGCFSMMSSCWTTAVRSVGSSGHSPHSFLYHPEIQSTSHLTCEFLNVTILVKNCWWSPHCRMCVGTHGPAPAGSRIKGDATRSPRELHLVVCLCNLVRSQGTDSSKKPGGEGAVNLFSPKVTMLCLYCS